MHSHRFWRGLAHGLLLLSLVVAPALRGLHGALHGMPHLPGLDAVALHGGHGAHDGGDGDHAHHAHHAHQADHHGHHLTGLWALFAHAAHSADCVAFDGPGPAAAPAGWSAALLPVAALLPLPLSGRLHPAPLVLGYAARAPPLKS